MHRNLRPEDETLRSAEQKQLTSRTRLLRPTGSLPPAYVVELT